MIEKKVKWVVKYLQECEPKEGYYLAFSGGKDSSVCKALLDMAGVKYEAVYRVTSVDPPELVRFIRDVHPDVKREVPRDKEGKPITMWNLIPKRGMPPTFRVRYCCEALKETGGDGRKVITGVRWEESLRRRQNSGLVNIRLNGKIKDLHFTKDFEKVKSGIILTNDNTDSRLMVEFCYKRTKVSINPIINWTTAEVWNFILKYKVPYCELYDEGFDRLGCIGCPLACTKKRKAEFERWPKYKEYYILAFQKLSDKLREQGKLENSKFGPDGQSMFKWWMKD